MFGLSFHWVVALSYAPGPNKHNFKRARPPHFGQNDCKADWPRRSLCWTGAKRTESSSRTSNRPTTPGRQTPEETRPYVERAATESKMMFRVYVMTVAGGLPVDVVARISELHGAAIRDTNRMERPSESRRNKKSV